ncbi:U6 snRNA-associated Sm-like protein LSm6-like [Scleropages formosus]|uniref:U6 snRNA-associated Sm-like protein LSm6 n=1 Tax=Scleropages formosus TaxID=113540 RepID=A0A0P7UTC9_SCLFO|nr:U6 snRNA-associated Sm-like protein LSm6-like [Scleropages formosus]
MVSLSLTTRHPGAASSWLNFCFRLQSHRMSLRKQTPSDFLKQIIGRPVVVKLNSGVDYRGVLACLDGYMNIAVEQTEEYVNGQLKNKYGDAFLRGNNVLYISTQKRKM